MAIELLLTLLAIFLLLALSAFFSGSETALTTASRARMHALESEGNVRAQMINQMLAAPERIIGTVLLSNNLVNILASALATSLLINLFGEVGVAYATLAITLLVVIFSEVLPKTYALVYADRISLAVAPIMKFLIVALWPFTRAVELVVSAILSLTPTREDDDANILSAHQEIRGTIQLQTKGGAVAKGDAHMLGGILDLSSLQVADIMIHRTKMEMVNADDPPEKIVEEVVKAQYSRVPIWKDEPENIVGILHTKDLLTALSEVDWDVTKLNLLSFASQPWFVPDTTTLKEQLNQFLKQKLQMSLVVDEYGEVQGLITLEDILEEIVGQIVDEHDAPEMGIRPQADDTVNVDGSVPIRDLNRFMDWDLPDDEATTVAGLVIHEAQTIPEPGQVFTFYGYRFEILRKNRNRIAALRVKPLESDAGAVGGAEASVEPPAAR
ncbi:conserved membrane protein of unknown function [Candidatus Filomicrobium marinum]|uniref:HlyC/CorC family transporter n=2 Tax=Filomicrobium TaxID=119044 RepID=A0A0D6JBC3_9HYPH|nr:MULTISPECIES: HlyC/CorC family transporter [Filomicrobium]MCV0370726.1 HlyC/CorC family transporter [Filomicrobium sp.]CFX06074.1 conserved membrane protein of unknown function [Candidatus Filomicrobium marinum]CPR16355.1 conserved membrane protein of unknown function [Candidatus Filomicrobium marinum]SDP55401.1 Mg2+ and Co2+ transporter CorB, contains DUF21, CBS pair, and CorC-HlyC domains [Filomicrobium insigne]